VLSKIVALSLFAFLVGAEPNHIGNSIIDIEIVGRADALWTFTSRQSHQSCRFSAPVFNIDRVRETAALMQIKSSGSHAITNKVTEHHFTGTFKQDSGLSLELIYRISSDSSVVRFRYVLHASRPIALTRVGRNDSLRYFTTSFTSMRHVTDVHLSEFNEMVHSYTASERSVADTEFANAAHAMGPILIGEDSDTNTLLLAYEHGSTAPDAFLQFDLSPSRTVSLDAVKANYVPGQKLTTYETVWMEAALSSGGIDKAAAVFRSFILQDIAPQSATRKPQIFYNTWNYQERNKWWNGKSYLDSMTPQRILAEIDAAHRMGVDVFVMDTGWYDKTGDWQVSRQRFPEGLHSIRERLDRYGMKLGLWFNPTAAAVSSRMYRNHKDCVRTSNGEEGKPAPVWETEESYPMCLVSRYADAFADELVRIAREYGVRYFKWDAIDQYGCDSPSHLHGNAANTREERADSYAFQLPLAMTRVVQKLNAAYPDAIVDFDVTEAGRAFGLSFLSAGKYFLINNGPYLFNYDLPIDRERQNWNLFFYPGPARTWICRTPLSFDRWIPSVLLLTHYFPDDPESSQIVNLGSLILGQNGIWGDLLRVSDKGVQLIAMVLSKYKQVREDMAASFPIRSGAVAGTREIHEKISEQTGRGGVVLFSTTAGRFDYITQRKTVNKWWATPGATVEFDNGGHAIIHSEIVQGASIVLFGAN
jgi:alpha-galactosidase